jgi:RimJ/RimL family protein N-acetyltransferase
MNIEPFKPEHFDTLILQPAQEYARPNLENRGYGEALASRGDAFTGFIDGRVVGCVGVLPMWEGRAEAWALLARDVGLRGMREVHNAVLRYLEMCPYRRLEAHCDADFPQARRWLEMLGFEFEGPLRAYKPDGKDCLRFARIKK